MRTWEKNSVADTIEKITSEILQFVLIIVTMLFVIGPIVIVLNDSIFEKIIHKTPVLAKFAQEYIDNVVPLLFSCLLGFAGAFLRMRIIESSKVDYYSIFHIAAIGSCMGVFSYVILQSKAVLRVAYPKNSS
jgi:hypothetical protein